MIDDIALDKYSFIRDAYLQRRRSLVFDGDAPEVPDASSPQQAGFGPVARRTGFGGFGSAVNPAGRLAR